MMIDNRGRHLLGCLSCNEWSDSAGNLVRLSVEDLTALHALREAKKLAMRRPKPTPLGPDAFTE
jgi:hypothetical protein